MMLLYFYGVENVVLDSFSETIFFKVCCVLRSTIIRIDGNLMFNRNCHVPGRAAKLYQANALDYFEREGDTVKIAKGNLCNVDQMHSFL